MDDLKDSFSISSREIYVYSYIMFSLFEDNKKKVSKLEKRAMNGNNCIKLKWEFLLFYHLKQSLQDA